MLTEGWDAYTVTQILGLRAFTSQLLCEQVVGRGLRRMTGCRFLRMNYTVVGTMTGGTVNAFMPMDLPSYASNQYPSGAGTSIL
jgi:superfamily II DNA or RNA helicase